MKKGMALCAGILRLLLAVSPASGADAALPPDEGTHIPARLVESVARQESSLNPWAVNVAGRDFYPVSREEAEHIITAAERAGASYDVGLMQINRLWIRRYGISPASLLNPDINKKWGTWILAQEIARHGYNWRQIPFTGRRTRQALCVARVPLLCVPVGTWFTHGQGAFSCRAKNWRSKPI